LVSYKEDEDKFKKITIIIIISLINFIGNVEKKNEIKKTNKQTNREHNNSLRGPSQNYK